MSWSFFFTIRRLRRTHVSFAIRFRDDENRCFDNRISMYTCTVLVCLQFDVIIKNLASTNKLWEHPPNIKPRQQQATHTGYVLLE